MEFYDVVKSRRMTRDFLDKKIDASTKDKMHLNKW
jgi:hypothetical protein